jgi:hypothetical protein
MTLEEWVTAVCAELGVEEPDVNLVLDFAGEVAHAVARPAAPLTSLLVGLAASSTADLPDVMERVRRLLPEPG